MAIVNQNGFSNPTNETDILPPGTIVQELDLSNMTKQDALNKLVELERQLQQKQVIVAYQGVNHDYTLGALGIHLDAAKTVDQVLANYNNMGLIKRCQARLHLTGQQLAVIYLDRNMTKAALQKIVNPLYIPAVNASPTVNSQGQVAVKPAQDGFRVDLNQFTEELLKQVNNNDSLSLELTANKIKPKLGTAEVTKWGITGLIAQYTTRFNSALTGRTNNIKIAADILDNLVVSPGEVISFNEVVGPREAEKGYQTAGVIVGNTLSEGLGGGICQVVTTLYNAVLLADLDIVQRGNHNIPISYAPIGLDAAVSYGSLDLKFKNNTSQHMLMKTSMQGNSIIVRVYGNSHKKKNIRLKSWVTETIEPKVVYKVDPTLQPGESKVIQPGARGYRAKAQRIVIEDGKEVKQEALPNSYYLPVEQIIAVQSETLIPGHEPVEVSQDEPTGEPAGEPVNPGSTPGNSAQTPGNPVSNPPDQTL